MTTNNYSIIFSSVTGNTKKLADTIHETLPQDMCDYFGGNELQVPESDLLYIGFWTDKGNADNKTLELLSKLKNKKIFLFGTPMHGNLGDHAIAIQEQYFFEDFFPDYEYFEILMPMYHTQKKIIKNAVTPEDLVVISGGGWMGNLWIHNECVIREIVQNYPNNKIIILPQTVYYTSDELGEKEYRITNEILKKHSNLHIFVRERKSYNFIKQKFEFTGNSDVYLVPDMVLYGKNIITKEKCTGHENVINVCIREDCESEQENIDDFYEKIKQNYDIRKVSTVIKSPVVLRKRISELQKSWGTFENAEITITDRLHAMLFSVLNGTPCIVLNNKTGKVFGVADWLDDTNMIVRADSLSEVLEKLKRTTIWKHKKYDREKLLNYFEKMADVIRKD